jgi:3-dehydroquinate dehydratase-2
MTRILILNGPNLNLLGSREPHLYGSQTLADIISECEQLAASLSITLTAKQSNHEGELVTWIQEARTNADGIIINAGAFTHTSIAIRDALSAFEKPIIEVHLSNLYKREEFRHHSFISDIATGCIIGLGAVGYRLALQAMDEKLKG